MRVLLVVGVVALLSGFAGEIDPYDFDITVTSSFPTPTATPQCGPPDVGGASTCRIEQRLNTAGRPLTGRASQRSTGRSGELNALCDMLVDIRALFRYTPPFDVEVTELGGTATQSCSWRVAVGGDELVGTMSGGGTIGLAGPTSGSYSGRLTVAVAGGTGELQGLVGGGTFDHAQEFPLRTRFTLSLLSGSAAAQPSRMTLRLRKGPPRVLIAAPTGTMPATADTGLRVVSVPGSTCSASATAGGRTVDLGRARDGNRDGLVVVAKRLRPKLRPGTWRLSVSCSWKAGTTRGTAVGRRTISVR